MTTETTSSSKTKSVIFLILFGFLLLIMLWLGLKTWRLYQVGQSLLARQAEVETLLADGLTNIDPDKAESLVLETREDIKVLKAETAVFMPLTPYLGWVPQVGSTLVNASALMTMADSGIDGAAFAVRGLKPALAIMQNDNPSEASMLSQLSSVLVDAGPDLIATHEKLAEVAAARATISNVEALPWRLQTLFALSDEWLPFAQESLALTAVLPEILGENGPRTYLLIAQNEDELRPTGGFISGTGTLVVENGEIQSINMIDANYVDNWAEKPYDFPPQPFYDYMGFDLFLFRDANFWPDFPTTAEKAMDLYSYGQDQPPLDGVIAIDQEFIRLLVEATGPIYIEERDLTITPQNTIETFQNSWATRESDDEWEWVVNRKSFIGIFAAAIIGYIENDFSAIDPMILTENMRTALSGKHLQIYLRDEKAAAILNENNWNGRLDNPTTQDFLAVVDTNLGINKVNIYINRTIDYQIALDNEGKGQANLNITYIHTGQGPGNGCVQNAFEAYQNGGKYLDMAENCYLSYLRVYVPEGSQLISGSEYHIPSEATQKGEPINSITGIVNEQPGLTTWDNFLMVPYGENMSANYQYLLPQITTLTDNGTKQYKLTVRKQAGTGSDSATISVILPVGATLIDASPQPNKMDGENVFFDIILDTDKIITVTYQ